MANDLLLERAKSPFVTATLMLVIALAVGDYLWLRKRRRSRMRRTRFPSYSG